MSQHDNDTCPHLVRASLLEAENARLKAEVERLRKATDALQADVELLRKAGDWMFNAIILNSEKDIGQAMDAWVAATEGKPSV